MTTPLARRQNQTRERILEATRQIITEKGLDQFSMRNLAEKVDYSPAALYKYFPNKEAILDAIREEGWQRLGEYAEKRTQGVVDPTEAMIASGYAWLDFVDAYPEHYQLMFSEPEERRYEFEDWLHHPVFQNMVANIQEGIDRGEFRMTPGLTATTIAFNLTACMHGICALKLTLFKKGSKTYTSFAEEAMRQFVYTIRR